MRGGVAVEPFEVARGFIDYIQHNAESCTFPAPVWTENAVHVAFFNGERKIVNSGKRAKLFGEVGYGEDGFHGSVFDGYLFDEWGWVLLHFSEKRKERSDLESGNF